MNEIKNVIKNAIKWYWTDDISLCEAERMIGEAIFDEVSSMQSKKQSREAEREYWRVAWEELLKAIK